jgi:hypothetical protein
MHPGLTVAQLSTLIDDLDRRILIMLTRSPAKIVAIARAAEICHLTARRRVDGLVGQGLVERRGERLMISEKGMTLLGAAAPARWVDEARIRASTARDVLARAHQRRGDGPEIEGEARRLPRDNKYDRLYA